MFKKDKEEKENIVVNKDTDISQYDESTQELIRSISFPFLKSQQTLYSAIQSQDQTHPTEYLNILSSMKKWKGERYDKGTWKLLPNGKYFDYIDRTYKDGSPPLSFFDWYCEFIVNESNYVNPARMGKCHQEWGELLQSTKGNVIMLCPRDHFKTSFLVVGYALYTICEESQIAKDGLMFISFSDDLARDNMESVKNNLLNNERIISFYGRLIDMKRSCNADGFYFTYQPPTARPGMICTSFQSGNITGRHPSRVWCDDIQDVAFTDPNMRKAINIFTKKLFPAVGAKGQIIVTGTIKGNNEENDIYLWLSKRYGFETYQYPAANAMPPMSDVDFTIEEVDEHVGMAIKKKKIYKVNVANRKQYQLLYPERYTIEDLVIKRLQMKDKGIGDNIFWSEYFLQALDPKAQVFKEERLGTFQDLKTDPLTFVKMNQGLLKGPAIWIDPGGKGKASHGNTVVVMTQDSQNKYYLLHFTRVRAGLYETAKVIQSLFRKFNCTHWGVEGNFNQAETHGETLYNYINQMDKDIPRPVIQSNSQPKLVRIRTIFSMMLGIDGMPKTFFVDTNLLEYDDFHSEYRSFPNRVDKKGEFDILDACCSLKTFILDEVSKEVVMFAAGPKWR